LGGAFAVVRHPSGARLLPASESKLFSFGGFFMRRLEKVMDYIWLCNVQSRCLQEIISLSEQVVEKADDYQAACQECADNEQILGFLKKEADRAIGISERAIKLLHETNRILGATPAAGKEPVRHG
jgi:hypothetical protein